MAFQQRENKENGTNQEIDIKKNNILLKKLLKITRLILNMGGPEPVNTDTGSDVSEIFDSIKTARNEWINACKDFEYADDQEIIDYYTYKIKACQVRYEYFLKMAKEKGLKTNLQFFCNKSQCR